MRCALCRNGVTQAGTGTVTLIRGDAIIIVRGVPADVCTNCGEQYFSSAVTEQLLAQAEQAIARGAEIEVLRFAA